MLEGIKEESVGYLFNLEVEIADEEQQQPAVAGVGTAPVEVADTVEDDTPEIVAKGLGESNRPQHLSYSAPTVDGEGGVETHAEDGEDAYINVSRNDPCPCGSGKKYKRCHGDPRNS
jgi:preprotein translocase subunit SecA